MSDKKIQHVEIENIGGDLRVRGEADNVSFRVDGDIPRIDHNEETGHMTVSCAGDCVLNIPYEASLNSQNVGGDAKITDFESDVKIGNVGSDLIIRHVRNTTVKTVGGDLVVRDINGDLSIQNVGGDMDCRDIGRHVELNHIGGDLSIRSVGGNCIVNNVSGDLLVVVDFMPELNYHFSTSSSLYINITPESNVTVSVPQGTEFDFSDIEAKINDTGERLEFVFGDGAATVVVHTCEEIRFMEKRGKKKRFFGFDFDFDIPFEFGDFPEPPVPPVPPVAPHFGDIRINDEPLGEFISRTVSDSVKSAAEGWGDWGKNFGERFMEKEKRHAEREQERMERQAERMQHQAERAREQAERLKFKAKRKHRNGRGEHRVHIQHAQSEPTAQTVSDEERMMILNMLEEGKITVEEAENLLSTMEGKS